MRNLSVFGYDAMNFVSEGMRGAEGYALSAECRLHDAGRFSFPDVSGGLMRACAAACVAVQGKNQGPAWYFVADAVKVGQLVACVGRGADKAVGLSLAAEADLWRLCARPGSAGDLYAACDSLHRLGMELECLPGCSGCAPHFNGRRSDYLAYAGRIESEGESALASYPDLFVLVQDCVYFGLRVSGEEAETMSGVAEGVTGRVSGLLLQYVDYRMPMPQRSYRALLKDMARMCADALSVGEDIGVLEYLGNLRAFRSALGYGIMSGCYEGMDWGCGNWSPAMVSLSKCLQVR